MWTIYIINGRRLFRTSEVEFIAMKHGLGTRHVSRHGHGICNFFQHTDFPAHSISNLFANLIHQSSYLTKKKTSWTSFVLNWDYFLFKIKLQHLIKCLFLPLLPYCFCAPLNWCCSIWCFILSLCCTSLWLLLLLYYYYYFCIFFIIAITIVVIVI